MGLSSMAAIAPSCTATPDAIAQISASDHRVVGDAGLVGGSPPRVRRQAARSRARVAEPAATPLNDPTAFHRSRRSAMPTILPEMRSTPTGGLAGAGPG